MRRSVWLITLLVSCSLAILIVPPHGYSHEPITTPVRFNKEIIRIFQKHCLACHNSGSVTDISLATYAQARPWAKAFKEEVLERRMPPAQAVSGFGRFQHDNALTQREIDQIVSWVEGGAPKGDDKDLPSAAPPGEWRLGEPDLVLKTHSEGAISTSGSDELRCLTVQTDLKEDRWLSAVDFQPGNSAAVLSASFGIAASRVNEISAHTQECGKGRKGVETLGAWMPGQAVVRLPQNVARLLPAGSRILLQIHYRKTERAATESVLGLYFSNAKRPIPLRTITFPAAATDIPAGIERQRLKTSYVLPKLSNAIAIRPLLFPFARSVDVIAYRPDGTSEVLVWARDYRYDWQPEYVFLKPVPLPRGTRIETTAYIDNSDKNANNPNQPAQSLRLALPLCELALADGSGIRAAPESYDQWTATESANDEFFVCSMHPEVMSDKPGQCPKCAMTLVRTQRPEMGQYELKLTTTPGLVNAGEKLNWRFVISHPKNKAPIKDFNIVHDMPYHLFIVSEDLSFFVHLHPHQQADGSFTIETTLPKPGAYLTYSDFFPKGGMPQVLRQALLTTGFSGDLFAGQAQLEPDLTLNKTQDGVKFDLEFNPAEPLGGKPATLKYHLTDAKTGAPIVDLQPYLGAWGHTLILSEDTRDYVHSHPTATIPDNADRATLLGGPNVAFDAFFPRPGNYRVWSQVQRHGKVITVSFTINVKRL